MASLTWKCPNCGGGLQFDPGTQDFKCEYCDSHFTQAQLEKVQAEEGEDGKSEGDARTGTAAVVYMCPSCGAEIVTDETTAATFCFYCHNPVVLQGQMEEMYEPDYVLPFAIEKKKAEEIFLQWLKKKKFVPSDFYAPEQIEKLSGVYFPYWLYSCKVDGRLDAEAVQLRVWKTGNIEYTETQKFDVSRAGQMKVDHVTRNALKKADRQLVESVMPFELKEMKPFSMGFLAGFFAEKRDMEKQEFEQEVENEVKDFTLDSMKDSISGYNRVVYKGQSARIQDARWNYALLPVWTLTYRYKKDGKIYYFACNGQTGKVCGKLPVDSGKLGTFFLKIFLPLLAALLVGGYLI